MILYALPTPQFRLSVPYLAFCLKSFLGLSRPPPPSSTCTWRQLALFTLVTINFQFRALHVLTVSKTRTFGIIAPFQMSVFKFITIYANINWRIDTYFFFTAPHLYFLALYYGVQSKHPDPILNLKLYATDVCLAFNLSSNSFNVKAISRQAMAVEVCFWYRYAEVDPLSFL